MNKKPLIGIVGKVSPKRNDWSYIEINDDIRYKLTKNGALVVGIVPNQEKIIYKNNEVLNEYEQQDMLNILKILDGVVLQGGTSNSGYEREIAKLCIKEDIPILGICSGFNNLIEATGGVLIKEKTDFHNQYGKKIAHTVNIEKSTLSDIIGEGLHKVNSIHNYIVKEESIIDYKIIAKCPDDNTIEAIELPNKKCVIGIKWHPEFMEDMNDIFQYFVDRCKR